MKKWVALFSALCMLCGAASACAAQADSTEAVEQFDSLAALAEPYGFKLGAVISYSSLKDELYLNLLKKHFNSLTPANELKAYSLLDQAACQKAEDGMPAMRFDKGDAILQFAKDNGIAVRGHVLTWDAYMPDWFFREGYWNGKDFVDAETMKARLKSYIEQVVSHFETNFPGVIYCWDVVNEAVGDSPEDWDAADARHIRTVRSGVRNYFYDVIGPDYVALSFLYAKDAVLAANADIKLFLNDYNAFQTTKRDAICALVESVNSFATDADGNARKLCDGVGMQGYIGGYGTQGGCMNPSDIKAIKEAIQKYDAMGLEVHVTEMAVRTYVNDADTMARHAEFYRSLFKMFKSVNAGESKPLTSISIWGLTDCDSLPENHYSYKLNSPYGGLVTESYAVKDSFRAVYDELSAK